MGDAGHALPPASSAEQDHPVPADAPPAFKDTSASIQPDPVLPPDLVLPLDRDDLSAPEVPQAAAQAPTSSAEEEWRDVEAYIRVRLRGEGSRSGSDAATLSRTLRVVGIGFEDGERVILASDGPMCETEAILVRLIDSGLDVETREPISDVWAWLKQRS